MVGLERETERLTAAKKREHFTTQADENEEDRESCDPHPKLCDQQGRSQATLCDIVEWSSYLHQVLPVDLRSPFHVSLQLNVDSTQQSKDKFSQLLLHLQGDLSSPPPPPPPPPPHTQCVHIQIQNFLKLIWYLCFPGLHFVKGELCICVVGLHCCGDLTPSILTLFTDHTLPPLPSLAALVLVGCCYHKTDSPQWSPVSTTARELMKGREDTVSTYALRLAAQETRER